MSRFQLPSGRVYHDLYRSRDGRILFQTIDSRSGAQRLMSGPWWDGRDRSRTLGVVASVLDIPELVEFAMELHQMEWVPNPRNGTFITFPLAFAFLPPVAGDKLIDINSQAEYTVMAVPPGIGNVTWSNAVLLDAEPEEGALLRWVGEARDRNLVDFYAEQGRPESPIQPEVSTGDVGTAYRKIKRPTVTYLLKRQQPFSIDGKPFGSHPLTKPRYRETFYRPEEPQRALEVLGWQMDNVFEFRCLHPRATVSLSLAEWFKGCVNRNSPSLRANGIPHLFYWDQRAESRSGRSGDDIAECVVQYYFQTEELEVHEVSTIRKLSVYARTALVAGALNDLPGATDPGEGWPGMSPFTGLYDQSGNPVFFSFESQDFGQTGVLSP